MTSRNQSVHKLYAFALAAVFALTLAGCGGGGGGGSATAPDPGATPMPEPTPQEMCEGDGGRYNADGSCTSAADLAEEMALSGAQDAAMAAYMAAMAAVSGAVDPVAMANAHMYAAMAKEASDAAAMATTSEMAMGYQMKAESAQASAEMAAGDRGLGLTMLANKIVNQSDIDNAVLEGKTGDDIPKPNSNLKERVGSSLDAAALSTAAQTAVDDTATPPVSGGSVSQGQTEEATPTDLTASAAVIHTPAGLRFTVTRGTGAVLRGENPTSLMTSGAKPTGGWPGAELVRTDRATPGDPASGAVGKTYVNVFTDVNAPTVKNTYEADETASPVADNNIFTATELDTHVTNKPEITADEIPNDGSSFDAMYNHDPKDNNPPVTGMFSCPSGIATSSGCAISVKDGVVESIEGYVFLPLISTGTARTADADYMAWGYWLTVPDATAATDVALSGAFASGNNVFQVKDELKGSATYNGDASGLYAAGGMVEYFDADVSLTANFGGTEGADSTPGNTANDPATAVNEDNDGLLLGAVTGTISNIRAGGMAIDGSLTLQRAPVLDSDVTGATPSTAGAGTGASVSGFDGAVSGSLAGRAMVGNWGGQFYGPNDADKPDAAAKAAETEFPTTAAGTFAASAPGNVNDPVRILGAFGAWKAE